MPALIVIAYWQPWLVLLGAAIVLAAEGLRLALLPGDPS